MGDFIARGFLRQGNILATILLPTNACDAFWP